LSDWRDDIRPRLASLHLSPEREAEIIDELSQHLDDHYRELIAAGETPDDARRLALAEFRAGNVLARYLAPLRQAHPPAPIVPGAPAPHLWTGLVQDVRYAVRSLRRQPAFGAITMLTLALGIGANSAIFALVDATLLRPLPFRDPGQLMAISERTAATPESRVAAANLADWHTRNTTFEAIGGVASNVASMVLSTPDGGTETVPRQWATAGIFDALGVTAVAGRTFLQADDVGRVQSVVITESFWRTRFNADPAVIGSTLRLDGGSWLLIGVVPDEAQLLGRTSMWALRPVTNLPPAARRQYSWRVIGRVKSGVSLDEARADLGRVADDLAREYPAANAGRSVNLTPLRDTVIGGDLRRTSTLFLGVVGIVLFICCANVASLLLTRTLARRQELAVRTALGADRRRLASLVLTESLVLAVGGGALGLALAAGILYAAPSFIPDGLLPATVTPALDLRVAAFCAGLALLSGLVFGLVPAWHGASPSPSQLTNTRVTSGGLRTRQWLVAGQVATAVAVLIGAGLLVRTFLAVVNVDRGYRATGVLTMMVDPPTLPSLMAFYDEVEGNIRALPGVSDVAWATTLPLGESYFGEASAQVEGDTSEPSEWPVADYQIISQTYFHALDLPVVEGRAFDSRDTADGLPVCMINEAFARRHLPGRSPIGTRLMLRAEASTTADGAPCTIVGVATQVKGRPDEPADLIQVYVPLAQNTSGDVFLLVRSASSDASGLGDAVRGAIARADTTRQTSVRNVQTLDQVMRDATSRHRFRAALVTAFAGLALVLAMVGVFGVLLYSVQHRVREIGIRRALGAGTTHVLHLIAGSGGRVIAAGAIAGLALAAMGTRLMSSMLFGVTPWDPVTFGFVAVLVAVTAVLAMAPPVWRAVRVDPTIALRNE
jgi:putative ABC transport system permease protein